MHCLLQRSADFKTNVSQIWLHHCGSKTTAPFGKPETVAITNLAFSPPIETEAGDAGASQQLLWLKKGQLWALPLPGG